ncbi:MAG: NAD-dependent epimerase/dehydratase family protein [Planctomycetota bacterium]
MPTDNATSTGRALTSRRGFLAASLATGVAPVALAGTGAKSKPGGVPRKLKILVLGGTGQTGPQFVRRAIAHGHDVTLFNRGNRNDELFPDVEAILGNRYPERGDGLKNLEAEVEGRRTWDVVLDVWPHIPRLVSATAELLKDNAERYTFVSSMSVYASNAEKDADEAARVLAAPNADDLEYTNALFGNFKAECENRVRAHFPGDRHTVWRPGLIVGPRDFSYRGVYWPLRARRGGTVLAPGTGDDLSQMIESRDLTAFQLRCMERGHAGAFNVVGPHPRRPLTMRRYLETCERVGGSDAEFVWAPAAFLTENGVGPWMQMPCWLPGEGPYAGFASRNTDKALGAGLTIRPLAETVEDTLQWFDGLPEERRDALSQRAGIPAEREAEVLGKLAALSE